MIDYLEDKISGVSLVDRMETDPGLKVVNSARISYKSKKEVFDEKDKKLTTFLWKNDHTSPFRHSYFTFHVKAPLFLFRQLMKYQVGSGFRTYEVDGQEVSLDVFDHIYDTDKGCSWNELSGRYTVLKDEFYIPTEARKNPAHGNKQASVDFEPHSQTHTYMQLEMLEVCEKAIDSYYDLIENGIAKEVARMILPQNIYSEAYWTVSLQAIMHFLHQRLAPEAQFEIRQLATAIYELVKPDLDKLGLKKEDFQ